MLRELKLLLYLFSFTLMSCVKKEIVVIMGEPVIANKYYSPDCYVKDNEKKIQINQAFLYRDNKLVKYITPQSESLVIENINNKSDLKEYRNFKKLIFNELNGEVDLFDKKYKVKRQNGDTIFLEKNSIIIIKNPTTF